MHTQCTVSTTHLQGSIGLQDGLAVQGGWRAGCGATLCWQPVHERCAVGAQLLAVHFNVLLTSLMACAAAAMCVILLKTPAMSSELLVWYM
jgi:hypothetical protein